MNAQIFSVSGRRASEQVFAGIVILQIFLISVLPHGVEAVPVWSISRLAIGFTLSLLIFGFFNFFIQLKQFDYFVIGCLLFVMALFSIGSGLMIQDLPWHGDNGIAVSSLILIFTVAPASTILWVSAESRHPVPVIQMCALCPNLLFPFLKFPSIVYGEVVPDFFFGMLSTTFRISLVAGIVNTMLWLALGGVLTHYFFVLLQGKSVARRHQRLIASSTFGVIILSQLVRTLPELPFAVVISSLLALMLPGTLTAWTLYYGIAFVNQPVIMSISPNLRHIVRLFSHRVDFSRDIKNELLRPFRHIPMLSKLFYSNAMLETSTSVTQLQAVVSLGEEVPEKKKDDVVIARTIYELPTANNEYMYKNEQADEDTLTEHATFADYARSASESRMKQEDERFQKHLRAGVAQSLTEQSKYRATASSMLTPAKDYYLDADDEAAIETQAIVAPNFDNLLLQKPSVPPFRSKK